MRAAAAGLLIAGLLIASPAMARQTDTTRVIALDSMRVTVARGTTPLVRLPAAIASVDRDGIRGGRPTVGLDESLDRVPGVFINNRYNFALGARISIRGLGARAAFGVRGVRVLADGVPLTMPDGQTNLNNLELGDAARIEILRGPSSALYGNAAGGVISVESEPPPMTYSTGFRAMGGNGGGDGLSVDPFFKLQAKAGGPLGNGGFIASISRMETDGYRDFSRAKQTQLNVVARHPIGDRSRLSVVLNAFDAPIAQSAGALPLDSVTRNRRMAWPNNVRTRSGEATRQVQAGLAFTHGIGRDRIDLTAYGLGRDVDNALPFGYIDLSRQGGGVRASWAGLRLRDRLAVTAGVDVEWQKDDRVEHDNAGGIAGEELRRDQQDQVASLGPFAQALWSVSDRTALLFGVRYDAVRFETQDAFTGDGRDDSGSRTLSALSPMIGLSRAVTGDLRLYANVGTAFQSPTTTELINAPPPEGEPCCPGGFNTDLDAQRAVSFEAGARGSVGRFTIDAAAYHMTVRNTIVPFQVADVEGREFFRNAGESRHRGVELAIRTTFGLHSATLAWTFNSFTFTDDGDAETDFEGNHLPGVPRGHLFAGVQLVPVPELRVSFEAEHTGEYFVNDANDATNDAATVLDVRIEYGTRIGDVAVRPFFSVGNITDTRYNSSVVVNAFGRRYYEPAPGRSVYFGFALATGAWSQ